MRNLLIICLIAALTALMGVFNQMYILSKEECIWYAYAAATFGTATIVVIIYEIALWNKNQKS